MLEVKTRAEAVPRARGESACFLNADCASPFAHFVEKFGTAIHDAELPSQSYNESFEQEQHDGDDGSGLSGAYRERRAGDKASDQVQTSTCKADHTSPPRNTHFCRRRSGTSRPCQQIRKISEASPKLWTDLWLLTQKMRHPGRHQYADLTENTLRDFLDEPV